jgi:hypothetical protein
MHILIAVTLIVACAAILVYAIWRVAQDLLIGRYAPDGPRDDREET